jgi:molybdopterin-guanine dinucleotide biosynthesis protein B
MQTLGIVGWSGSGKTTLLTALIETLTRRGLRVSSVKHAHHRIEFDRPGKDSHRHAEAGAEEVILATGRGFALFSAAQEVALPELIARLQPVDLVLVEGFKNYPMPKIEVFRPALGKPPLWPEMEVLAVASDAPLGGCPVPVLALDAPELVADFICERLRLHVRS